MGGEKVIIAGGGLSGAEAAFQLLDRGFAVEMLEMRPNRATGAHKTAGIAELVCSNSLKSEEAGTASGLLKEEASLLHCKLLELARENRVPSGSALSVDREAFSEAVERELKKYGKFSLIREELTRPDRSVPTIIATGPLTSPALADELARIIGCERLFFYDAVAPIVEFSSVDMSKAYFGGRYGKGGEDYLNLPMSREEYDAFYDALISAETAHLHEFDKRELFEGCMPIEEMARRGRDTLRFGPLRPVGLKHPQTGERACAVVQLRKEDVAGNCYNLVGFQTNLTFGEQRRVFGMIPALSNAEYVRFGKMHRNTFIDSPRALNPDLSLKAAPLIYAAGQLTGVEGYMESIVSGLTAGISLARRLRGKDAIIPSENTLTGALCRYVSSFAGDFQPMNANFGLLPTVEAKNKSERKLFYRRRALGDMEIFAREANADRNDG